MSRFDLQNFDYRTLRGLSEQDEQALAGELRAEIISSVSKNGGHLASNLGTVELTIALLRAFDPYKDDILFDVGHQAYAYKILTGRDISRIRKKDGPSGFQKIGESPADKFESGHSSTSIAAGLGIAAAKKLAGDPSATVIVIGDASIASGLAFEALNSLDDQAYGKLIIILNDNNMSISAPKGALSAFFNSIRTSTFYQESAGAFKKTFDRKGLRWFYRFGVWQKNLIKRIFTKPNYFESFACSYLGPIDGHDFKKMDKFLARAQAIDHTVLLHVRTKKGKGYQPAEDDETGYWHGTSAFDPETGLPLATHPETVSFSHLAGEAILAKMKEDGKTVLITPAMKKGAHLEEAFQAFPSRCFDVGIAEEEAVELAAGFALKGFHPILSVYSTFLQRGYDQLLNDLSRLQLPVLLVVDRAGLVGEDGSSHQGLFDSSMALSLPHSALSEPYTGEGVQEAIKKADFSFRGPYFIRVERTFAEKDGTAMGRSDCVYLSSQGRKKALVCLGAEGKEAGEKASGQADVVLLSQLKPLPAGLLAFLLRKEEVLVYDPTGTEIGFPSYLAYELAQAGYKGAFKAYAVKDGFVAHAAKAEQLEENHLDPASFLKEAGFGE
jgi:1-deoxy-D-xylulose-5-phosphate synthase